MTETRTHLLSKGEKELVEQLLAAGAKHQPSVECLVTRLDDRQKAKILSLAEKEESRLQLVNAINAQEIDGAVPQSLVLILS